MKAVKNLNWFIDVSSKSQENVPVLWDFFYVIKLDFTQSSQIKVHNKELICCFNEHDYNTFKQPIFIYMHNSQIIILFERLKQ